MKFYDEMTEMLKVTIITLIVMAFLSISGCSAEKKSDNERIKNKKKQEEVREIIV